MRKILRPFQRTGAQFLASRYHALLGDEPGLGKTLQAIAATRILGLKNILVVCPASVRLNWRQEIYECLDSEAGWEVISYNQAVKGAARRDAYDAIVLDEAHFLKTPDSQRTQAIYGNKAGLARRAQYKWALTGTFILNRPVEMYPTLKTLAADTLKPYDNYSAYVHHFCCAFWDGYGLNVKGASYIEELALRLNRFMLRRTKKEVLPQLPPRILSRVPIEIDSAGRLAIKEAEKEILSRETAVSAALESASQLGDISTLLRVLGEAKVGAVLKYLRDLMETEEKIVVFARHRNVIATLARGLSVAGIGNVVYWGGMNDREKAAAVNSFKAEKAVRVFIGNIQAAGTGINGLQEVAATVVFAELSWTPGEMSQAIDRVHRMGQGAEAVNVHLLHVPGSLEAAILGVQDAKNAVISRLLETSFDRAAAIAAEFGVEAQ